METKFSMVKIDHIDENGVAHIDSYLTEDENEEGKVLGYIVNGEVYWKDHDAMLDPLVKSVIKEFLETRNKPLDVSYIWHTSNELIDFTVLGGDDRQNMTFGAGVRHALRMLEELGVITMGDIDRSPEPKDKKVVKEKFGG